jgi:hypothetical protein
LWADSLLSLNNGRFGRESQASLRHNALVHWELQHAGSCVIYRTLVKERTAVCLSVYEIIMYEGVREWGTEEDIWAFEGRADRGVKEIALWVVS